MVTKLTLRTHDLPAFFGAAWGMIKAHSDAAFQRLIARFIDFYAENLFNPHWGEQISLGPDNTLETVHGLPGPRQRRKSAPFGRRFFDWAKASPQDFNSAAAAGRARSGAALLGFLGQPLTDPGSARRRARLSRVVARRPGSGRRVPAWLRFALAARGPYSRKGSGSAFQTRCSQRAATRKSTCTSTRGWPARPTMPSRPQEIRPRIRP